MFKDKLKKDLDKLSPSANVKAEIFNKIQQDKPKKVYNFKFASAIAAMLAIVIALGVIIDGRKTVPVQTLENESIVETVKTKHKSGKNIETIYKHIKELEETTLFEDWICYYSSDGETAIADGVVSSTQKSPGESVVTQTTSKDKDFSQTNTREQNVDEEDIIKTDGDYIYRMSYSDELYIFNCWKGE